VSYAFKFGSATDKVHSRFRSVPKPSGTTSRGGSSPTRSAVPSPLPRISHKNVAAIAGGVVAGVFLLSALILLFFCRRRSYARSRVHSNLSSSQASSVEPFVTRNAYAPVVQRPFSERPTASNSLLPNGSALVRELQQTINIIQAQLQSTIPPAPIPTSPMPPTYTRMPPPPPPSTYSASSSRPPTFVSRMRSQRSLAPSSRPPSFTTEDGLIPGPSQLPPLPSLTATTISPSSFSGGLSVDTHEPLPLYTR
jgi:hypothetical protein